MDIFERVEKVRNKKQLSLMEEKETEVFDDEFVYYPPKNIYGSTSLLAKTRAKTFMAFMKQEFFTALAEKEVEQAKYEYLVMYTKQYNSVEYTCFVVKKSNLERLEKFLKIGINFDLIPEEDKDWLYESIFGQNGMLKYDYKANKQVMRLLYDYGFKPKCFDYVPYISNIERIRSYFTFIEDMYKLPYRQQNDVISFATRFDQKTFRKLLETRSDFPNVMETEIPYMAITESPQRAIDNIALLFEKGKIQISVEAFAEDVFPSLRGQDIVLPPIFRDYAYMLELPAKKDKGPSPDEKKKEAKAHIDKIFEDAQR